MVSTSYFCNGQINSHVVCRNPLSEPRWALCAENEDDVDTIFIYNGKVSEPEGGITCTVKLLGWFLSCFWSILTKALPISTGQGLF